MSMLNFLLSTFYYSLLKKQFEEGTLQQKVLVCLFSCHICNCFNTEQNLFLFDLFNNPVLWSPIFVSLSPRCIWRESLVIFLKCLLHVCLSGSFISMRNRWHCVHWTKPIRGTDAASQNWLQKNLLNVPVAILNYIFSTQYSGSYKALVICVERSFHCLHWE